MVRTANGLITHMVSNIYRNTCCIIHILHHYVGAVAGVIDIGASWLSDVKEGVCRDAFWLNKEQCCWSANDTTLDDYDRCKQVTIFAI